MRCPGQDWSQWTGEFAFEAPCPKCDAAVEFFKDETSARCPNCGYRFQNPRASFDCAKWCSFAEQCLGFVPEREAISDPGEGALAGRLIRAVKEACGADQARVARAMMVFHQARELLPKEGGDPRIILAAALLLAIAGDRAARAGQSAATKGHQPKVGRSVPPAEAARTTAKERQILKDVGLDQDTTDCICRVIDSRRRGQQLDTIEFQVVSDSELLAKMAAAKEAGGNCRKLLELAESRLRTESAKRRARRLFQVSPGEREDETSTP
jgi:hypothetical protein